MLAELTLEITQRCPNRCTHCSSMSDLECLAQISCIQLLAAVTEAKSLGLKEVSLSGGEPLMHPELEKILLGINQLGLKTTIYTTGIMGVGLNRISFDFSSTVLKPNKIIFSIHSTNEKTHDAITQEPGSCALTMKSLVNALALGLDIEVHLVPMKTNLEDIEVTLDDLIKIGVRRISFLRLVPQGRAKKNWSQIDLCNQEILKLHDLLRGAHDKWGEKVRIGIPFSGWVGPIKKCQAGWNKLLVRYDGEVFPCEAFKDQSASCFSLGRIEELPISGFLQKFSNLDSFKILESDCALDSCPAQVFYLNRGKLVTA